MSAYKKCRTCKRQRRRSSFFADRKKPDGLYYECKHCARSRNNEWCRVNRSDGAGRAGNTEACRKSRRAGDPIAIRLRGVRARAKRAGIAFEIEPGDIRIPDRCPVFHTPLQNYIGRLGRSGAPGDAWSIDRIDPKRGYVRGNIVVVSLRANRIKMDASIEELEALARFYRGLTHVRR